MYISSRIFIDVNALPREFEFLTKTAERLNWWKCEVRGVQSGTTLAHHNYWNWNFSVRSTPFPCDNSLVRIMGKNAVALFERLQDINGKPAKFVSMESSLLVRLHCFDGTSFFFCVCCWANCFSSLLFGSIRFSLIVCARVISQIIHGKNLQTKNQNEFVSRVPI